MYKKLIEVTENWGTMGIFYYMSRNSLLYLPAPTAQLLNMDYYGNRSGGKIISPLLDKLLIDNDILKPTDMSKIADIIISIYGDNFLHQYKTMQYEYNPIENYDLTEERKYTSDDSSERTGNSTGTETGTNTGTETKSSSSDMTTTPSTSETDTGQLSGFNSSSFVDGSKTTKTTSGTIKETGTASDSVTTGNNATSTLSNDYTDSSTLSRTYNETLKRHGNIGVTTSQQMIESERNLWKWVFYREYMYPAVDEILTCPIF